MGGLRSKHLIVLGALWAAAILAGFTVLLSYKSTPGRKDEPPARWPGDSRLELAVDRPTLVMFAHPRCSCTRASLSELNQLLQRLPDPPRAYVAFLLPAGASAEWRDTDLWDAARRIPGVRVFSDPRGVEAARFHATTSGATVLYGARGELLFAGGITSARGHEGSSFGQRRILALLGGEAADRRTSPVFGCALHDNDDKKEVPP